MASFNVVKQSSRIPIVINPRPGSEVWVVEGADTTLGYAIARFALEAGKAVIVTCPDITKDERLALIVGMYSTRAAALSMDIRDEQSIARAVEDIHTVLNQQYAVDVLITVTGEGFKPCPPTQAQIQDFRAGFAENVIGPMLLIQKMYPLLRRSQYPRVVSMGSVLGSNYHAVRGWKTNTAVYSTTKAAANMMMTQFALSEMCEGIIFTTVNPGWVGPEEGGDPARAQELLERTIRVIETLDDENNGQIVDYQGQTVEF